MGTTRGTRDTTPVVVGVGQVTNRPHTEGEGSLAHRPEPVALMVEAVDAAVEDCDGAPRGGRAPAGRALLARAGLLAVSRPLSWEYANPATLVADGLGIEPDRLLVTSVGGDNVQRLVNAIALAIGRGELEVAVVVGADCVYTQAAARRHPERPTLPWTLQPAGTPAPEVFGGERRPTTEAEEACGLDLPVDVYPLFENALRAEAGHGLERHRHRLGTLWSRFSEVAATNPHAWLRAPRTADEITEVGEANRMVSYPYTKLLTANMQVDQGAAIVLASASAADAAGVPRDRWVFPLAGADAEDHWFLSHRADFHSSPAIRLAGASTLALGGTAVEEVAHLDLYSCFPAAVQIAAAELGLSVDEPSRPLTVTGGLTFGGGPGNNYTAHSLAAMVGALRDDPGTTGLLTGVGWYLTKHSVCLYGTEPPEPRRATRRASGGHRGRRGGRVPACRAAGRDRGTPPVHPGCGRGGRGDRRDLHGDVPTRRHTGTGGRRLPHDGRAPRLGDRHRPRPAHRPGDRGGVRPTRHAHRLGGGRPPLTGRAGAAQVGEGSTRPGGDEPEVRYRTRNAR